MKVQNWIAAAVLMSGCPWDAQGNYTGERLPDGGIPASAFEQIDVLEQWQEYAQKYGGRRSRPKPTPEQLCSFWPGTAVRERGDSPGEWADVGVHGATTRAWVLAVLGEPPGGVGQETRDSVIDAYRWDPTVQNGEKVEEGGITLVYALVGGCQAGPDQDQRDCDTWKLQEIRTLDPQVYLYCWRNADITAARKLPKDLVQP